MCTVTINVDDATVRRINPDLTTREKEMQVILLDRIRKAEAGEEPLVSHQEVSNSIRSKYGF